jgi:ribosomal protein L30/L7E
MRKLLFVFALSSTFFFSGCDTLKNVAGTLSNFEIAQGLKEALTQGLFSGFEAFANPNQGNALVRFAFPGEAAKIEKTLRDLGLTQVVNNVTAKYTNAMSLAVQKAKPIFLNSVKNMSIGDAAGILLSGNKNAATQYFKSAMSPQLMTAFRPIVDSTIRTTGAGNEYNTLAKAYNSIPLINKKLEPSLNEFIAARAVDAMFLYVANKEADIRSNLSSRTTPLLQRVFGYADLQAGNRPTTN